MKISNKCMVYTTIKRCKKLLILHTLTHARTRTHTPIQMRSWSRNPLTWSWSSNFYLINAVIWIQNHTQIFLREQSKRSIKKRHYCLSGGLPLTWHTHQMDLPQEIAFHLNKHRRSDLLSNVENDKINQIHKILLWMDELFSQFFFSSSRLIRVPIVRLAATRARAHAHTNTLSISLSRKAVLNNNVCQDNSMLERFCSFWR